MKSERVESEGPYLSIAARFSILLIAPFSGLAQAGLTPILPKITEHFASVPDAETLVRLMVTSLSFMMIAGSLVAGVLAARIGAQRLLFICLGLYAVAGGAGYLLDNLYLLVASRMLLGVVTAAWGVLIATIITTQVAPQQRDKWLGFFIVAGTFGMLPLTILTGILGKMDWRLVFLLYTLVVPIMLLLKAVLPPAPAAQAPESDAVSKPRAAHPGIPWGLVILGLLCGAVGSTAFLFLPFYLKTLGVGDPTKVASVIVVSSISCGVTSFLYGWLRKRFSVLQIFVFGYAMIATGLVVAMLTGTYGGVFGGIVIYGLGFGSVAPNLFAAAAAAARPEHRAWVMGFMRAGVYSGPLLVQIPLEPISKNMGAAAAIIGIGVVAVIALFASIAGQRAYAPAT
jgi:MFS family permease